MLLVLEIGMLVGGLVALMTGRVAWLGGKRLEGGGARVFGVVLALPLPLSFLAGFLLVVLEIVPPPSPGMDSGAFLPLASAIESAIIVACLLLAVLLGLVCASLPPVPLSLGAALMEPDPVEEVPPPPSTDDVDFVALGLAEAGAGDAGEPPRSPPREVGLRTSGLPRSHPESAPIPEERNTRKETARAVLVAVLLVALMGTLYLIAQDRSKRAPGGSSSPSQRAVPAPD